MDQAMKSFVERENIANYIKRLNTEADPVKRTVIATLLAEEKEKQVSSDAAVTHQELVWSARRRNLLSRD